VYIAVDSVEVKIEADDNDISESPHSVMPTTGMFAVSNAWYNFFFFYF